MEFDKIMQLAIKQAQKSPSAFKHGAVCLTRGNKIVSYGFNRPITYSEEYRRCQIHAEIDAICGIHSKILRECYLVVVRITKTNMLTSSKPCNKCQNILRRKGIRKIYFSDESRQINSIML